MQAAVDQTPDGATAVQFDMGDFALGSTSPRVRIQVTVSTQLVQTVHGPWTMRRP